MPQKKSINPDIVYRQEIKYMNDVSCVDHLSSIKSVTNVPVVAPDLPVGARLHQFRNNLGSPGGQSKSCYSPQRRIHSPLAVPPNLTRLPTIISCCVNPHRNLYLVEALHQLKLMNKNAVELVTTQNSQGYYNRLIWVLKPNNRWKPILDLSTLNKFLKTVIQSGDTRDNKNLPMGRGVGHLHKFQRCILPHTDSKSVQEVHVFSCPGSVLPIQSTAIWSVHRTLGVHCSGEGGQTDNKRI